MINTENFISSLIRYGFVEFVGVPCSYLSPLINCASNMGRYIAAANEADAVAYAFGARLAGKKVAVLMQNSGFTNALSPITSLNYIYGVPAFMLVGYRGGGNDEPQHRLMGEITERLVTMTGATCKAASGAEDVIRDLDGMYASGKSLVYLVRKGDFSAVPLDNAACGSDGAFERDKRELSRNDILRAISELRDEDTLVVTTTGFISREMYDNYKNDKNFYMVGSMGCAISIGYGLARHLPGKKVIVVDGDGSFLMRPSGTLLFHETGADNLLHAIIDNGAYESTGGQRTVADKVDIGGIVSALYRGRVSVYNRVVSTADGIRDVLKQFIYGNGKGVMARSEHVLSVVCKVNMDNNNDLGRLKEPCEHLADIFMKSVV